MTPELRSERAHGLHVFERNFADAEKDLVRALREKPRWGAVYVRLAMLYTTQGRFEEALELVDQSRSVDPLSPAMPPAETFVYLCQRDFKAATVAGKRSVDLHPYHPLGRALFAHALQGSGQLDEARKQYQLAYVMCPDLHWLRVMEGVSLAQMGRKQEASDVLAEMLRMREVDYVDAYFTALLYDALDSRDGAVRELERAVEENSATLFLLDVDPRMDPLRTDCRFAALRDRAVHPLACAAQ
jgi:tetratricopeptide (TPR) repeat protein